MISIRSKFSLTSASNPFPERLAGRWFISPQYLADLKAINRNIRVLPPLGKPDDFAAVARLEPYWVDAGWDILSPELIARCHAAGIKVFSDALGEHERVEDYLQAIRWGIDVIQTDHPLRVFRAIELHLAEKTTTTIEKRKPRVDGGLTGCAQGQLPILPVQSLARNADLRARMSFLPCASLR